MVLSDASLAATSDTATVLLCRACGYDVRGLDGSSTCPECGTPVARTLAGDRLDAAPIEWVRRVAVGLWLDAAGTGLSFLLLIPGVDSRLYGYAHRADEVNVQAWLVFLAVPVLGLAGTWLLTTREPGVWKEPLGSLLRLLLRVGATVEALLRIGLAVLPRMLSGNYDAPPPAVSWATFGLGLAVVAWWWVYVRRLQLRIPRPGLALAAQFTMVGVLITTIVRHWLPWPLMAVGWLETSIALTYSPTIRIAEAVFALAAAVIAALTARELGLIAAAQAEGQNPDGGSSSQDADSPVRG